MSPTDQDKSPGSPARGEKPTSRRSTWSRRALVFLLAMAMVVVFINWRHPVRQDRALSVDLELRLSADVSKIDFTLLPTAAWDRVYFFAPYTGPERLETVLGRNWPTYARTSIATSDGICLVVFTLRGQVVHWFEQERKIDLSPLDNGRGYTRDEAIFAVHRVDGRTVLMPIVDE